MSGIKNFASIKFRYFSQVAKIAKLRLACIHYVHHRQGSRCGGGGGGGVGRSLEVLKYFEGIRGIKISEGKKAGCYFFQMPLKD